MKIPGRENYYKYQNVKARLEEELQVEQTARQIAEKLKIAVSTFHKYRNLLQLEKKQQFMTSDERTFLEGMTSSYLITATGISPEKPEQAQKLQSKLALNPEGHAKPASSAQKNTPAAPEDPTPTSKRKK